MNLDQKIFKIRVIKIVLFLSLNTIVFFRILNPALEMLFAESKFKAAPSFQFTKLQALPCGCPTVPFNESDKFLSKYQFIYLIMMLVHFSSFLSFIATVFLTKYKYFWNL